MFDVNFIEEHRPFCEALGLNPDEIETLNEILEEFSGLSDAKEVHFDLIKETVFSKGGREQIAIAALALLKAYFGEKLIYLLVRSLMPSYKIKQ
mgnify:FL=1